MVRNICLVIAALGLFGCSGQSDEAPAPVRVEAPSPAPAAPPPPTYVPAPEGATSLLVEASAVREPEGGVEIRGQVLLPPSTRIWVERISSDGRNLGTAKTVVGPNGEFVAGPFSDKGRAPAAGPAKLRFLAHFTTLWQADVVLQAVGTGGSKLPQSALTPDDEEFPTAGGHWMELRDVVFPEIPESVVAIDRVKSAKLTVRGQGASSDSVGAVVDYFASAPGFRPIGWSAELVESKWVVTLDCMDGSQRKRAQWEYDPSSKSVRYLDPLAKLLSWLPAD